MRCRSGRATWSADHTTRTPLQRHSNRTSFGTKNRKITSSKLPHARKRSLELTRAQMRLHGVRTMSAAGGTTDAR